MIPSASPFHPLQVISRTRTPNPLSFLCFSLAFGSKGRGPWSLGEACRTPDLLRGQGLLPWERDVGGGLAPAASYHPQSGKLCPGDAPLTDVSGLHTKTNSAQSLKEQNHLFIYWSKTSTGREGLLFWQLSQWTLLPRIQMHQKAPRF